MLKFSKFVRDLCTVLLTLYILVTLPVTVILLLPFYLLRWTVSNLRPLLRPDLAGILPAQSSLLAADTIYIRPRINIAIHLKLHASKRIYTKAEIVRIWNSDIIHARNAQGELLYPEFQQFITTWMGYPFWKWESNFRMENHVYSIEGSLVRPDQYLNRQFSQCQSPWELIIFETPGKGVIQLTLRFHHALADGYAIFNALTQLMIPPKQLEYHKPDQNTDSSGTSRIRYYFQQITFPIRAIYDLVKDQVEPQEKCVFDPPVKAGEDDENLFLISTASTSEKINLTIVKEIKEKFQVSSSSVILAAVAGGFRNYLVRNGHEVPKYIKTSVPALKLPRKSLKLINKFSAITVKLPIGEEDAISRLREIDSNFRAAKRSTGAVTTYFITALLGGLPNFMTSRVLKRPWPPYLISPIVGPQGPVGYNDIQVEEINFTMACHKYGVLTNICSYNQHLQLSISANKAVLPYNNLVGQLQNSIVEELIRLQTLCSGDQSSKLKV